MLDSNCGLLNHSNSCDRRKSDADSTSLHKEVTI